MASRSFKYAVLYSCLLASISFAKESAWNGHTIPGSTQPSTFTPYYVPLGAKSYDSSSPFIHYTGTWIESHSRSYVEGSIQTTVDPSATVIFGFSGTGIEWFGNVGRNHGKADVYIDGKLVDTVDAWRDTALPQRQQRIFCHYGLPPGKHVLNIKNAGHDQNETPRLFSLLDLDALVVTQRAPELPSSQDPFPPASFGNLLATSTAPSWTLTQKGSTGVHAMQLAIVSDTHALVIDKVEHNPLDVNNHPAWAALYNLDTHSLTPLQMESNSFCAGGSFLSNGTLINVGGNPVVEDRTSSADFGDLDGMQAVRLFQPCDPGSAKGCDMYENHSRIRMASPRWYNTILRIFDGSALIIGGSKRGGWMNNVTDNNPTYEFWPPKAIHGSEGLPIHSPFLVDTLNSNLFPIAFSLPDGKVFIAANNDAMIYDWTANTERRLPSFPNGVRVTYPMTGTALLLPLTPENNYTPEILVCGGSAIDDHRAAYDISSQEPASSQCSRMVLTDEGISKGWEVEQMPEARLMPDAVLLPDGKIVIVNGAKTGISGYGNVKDQVGFSNADHPALTPVLYDPAAPLGQRFSSAGMPTSNIPRLYHSVATLTPKGDVMIAGSNPNLDRSEVQYGTEYRVEWLSPPYMAGERPQIFHMPRIIRYGREMKMKVNFAKGGGTIRGIHFHGCCRQK